MAVNLGGRKNNSSALRAWGQAEAGWLLLQSLPWGLCPAPLPGVPKTKWEWGPTRRTKCREKENEKEGRLHAPSAENRLGRALVSRLPRQCAKVPEPPVKSAQASHLLHYHRARPEATRKKGSWPLGN